MIHFTIAATKLQKALKTVAYAMSKDEKRYYLKGVFFEVTKEKLTLTATDGHQLATTEVEIASSGELSIIVPDNVALQLIKAKAEKDEEILVTMDESIEFEFKGSSVRTSGIDATFPNYKRVMPKYKNPFEISFNSGYLENLRKAVGKKSKLTIICGNPDEAVTVRDGNSTFLLMPMRGGLNSA